jgi:hypothetical protein
MMDSFDLGRCQPVEFRHDAYESNERDVLIRHAVSRLPHMYRSIVELCDFQNIPMKEVARTMGLTVAAVKSRRHRARQKLLRLAAKLKWNVEFCQITSTRVGHLRKVSTRAARIASLGGRPAFDTGALSTPGHLRSR